MPPLGFEPTITVGGRPQTYASDRAATGTGIYNYIPETNRVSTVYSVAAVLYLQSVLHVVLFFPQNMFCTFRSALPAVCVQCPIWLFFLQFLNPYPANVEKMVNS